MNATMNATTNDGTTMDVDPNMIPGGAGWIGAAGAAIIGGVLWLRNFLSKSATDRAADTAQTAVIEMLNKQLATEQGRSESYRKSLDDAIEQISGLRRQVADLTDQVTKLQAELRKFQPPAGTS